MKETAFDVARAAITSLGSYDRDLQDYMLVLFPAAGEFAWYFPKYECFRWADGGWRPRCLIDPLPDLQWDRPQSNLSKRR